ncbi:MAG TPA: SDR family oxidoreductase [Thermotogota bacterium]|nr:SDR family oxidoreductase [Thermotogota bacterium]
MQTALVTGGAGFIGSHIVDALIRDGCNVVALDDLSTGSRRNLFGKDVQLIEGDICDASLVRHLFEVHKPHFVFHLAAQISVSRSVREPGFDAKVNIMGTVNILHACVENHVEKLIFTSSGGVMYGDAPARFPTPETEPRMPSSPYGISKMAGEAYCAFFQQEYGLPFTALRYANVYGPRQNPHGEAGVVAIFTEKMIKNETVTINGDGEYFRDYVYVDDVVRANLLSMHNADGAVLNVGTGVETSVNGLFAELKAITGYHSSAVYGSARPGDLRRSALDSTLAQQELGWQPAVPLKQGLIKTFEYFSSTLGM